MGESVRFTNEAVADLIAIRRRIAVRSTTAADNVLKRIDAKCRMLAEMPGLGASRGHLVPGLRIWTIWSYLIFYRPMPGGILVIRVVHGRRNLKKLFPKPKSTG